MRTNILILLLFIPLLLSSQTLERIEPPNWWVGMESPHLQIMLYGQNIASYNVVIDNPGIRIDSSYKLDSPNYQFLNLYLEKNLKPGVIQIKLSDGDNLIVHDYQLFQKGSKESEHPSINPSDVIYLITPDRFANGDYSNDTTDDTLEKLNRNNPDGRHGGDIKGILNHFSYIKDLGVTTIWLNPFLENDQSDFSYHGYAISDFYKTDSRLGSNEDFIELVKKCHQNGMKVLMDQVFNHCGSGHWWMKDLPSKDWVTQWDNFTPSNFVTRIASDPYAPKSEFDQLTKGWFDRNMPDLNLENEVLRTYMIQNSLWWIEHSKIDGIRMDTYAYPNQEAMAEWMFRISKEYPNFYVVAETLEQKASYLSYWVGHTNKNGYVSNIKSASDYPLYFSMISAFGRDGNVIELYDTLAEDFIYANPYQLKTFNGNHDQSRLYAKLDQNKEKVKMSMAFLLTTRGIPQIYYGDELLMSKSKPDGQLREDFPGGWKEDSRNAFESRGRTADENEIISYLTKVLQWRKNSTPIHNGRLTHYFPKDNIYVYFRHNEQSKVMVVLNNNDRDVEKFPLKRFKESLNGYTKGRDILKDGYIQLNTPLKLKANEALILDLIEQ
ncbi:alpha-amylase family glycosyl hydrolase [Muricauda sp. ANG21]|uniref:alpha-amylase family glycosyl hydrolase n=1 Tax=Allomuricauda sp. ANG21 TaxID=3042468 RepID=UPI0034552323